MDKDTIAAIATPQGSGGISIIRISGICALEIAKKISHRAEIKPRYAHFANFYDLKGEKLDEGLLLYFPAPNSFTGEDVVELQGHGGIAVADSLLKASFALGARQAKGGEFSQRAFLNNKMDLTQAEAVADLINAQSLSAVKAANKSLSGEFSKKVNELNQDLFKLRVFIEAALDFADEEDTNWIEEGKILEKLKTWGEKLNLLIKNSQQGKLLNEGINLVLAGSPNAGKSSLLNALAGEDLAIVTPIEGTTRDIVRAKLIIAGMPINVLDTAGLRESQDLIEIEGIKRSREAIKKADLIIYLIDGSKPYEKPNLGAEIPVLEVFNKADLVKEKDKTKFWICAKNGEGLEELKTKIAEFAGRSEEEPAFIARARHLEALQNAQKVAQQAIKNLDLENPELSAQDLRDISQFLEELTGKIHSEDILDAIFSDFCIGK